MSVRAYQTADVPNKGFSALELLFAVFILTLLAAIVFVSFSGFFSERELDAAVEDTVAAFNEARSLTLASHDTDVNPQGKRYGVSVDANNNTLEIFSGLNPGAVVKTISLSSRVSISASVDWIVYERITGNTNNSIIVTLTSRRSDVVRVIQVYTTGAVEVQ